MEELNRNDFNEDIIYIIKCPKCNEHIETGDDINYEESITCNHCYKTFKLID